VWSPNLPGLAEIICICDDSLVRDNAENCCEGFAIGCGAGTGGYTWLHKGCSCQSAASSKVSVTETARNLGEQCSQRIHLLPKFRVC
jgi:hypothetical protein